MPPHARSVSIGRGHRFAAYPRCSADVGHDHPSDVARDEPAPTDGRARLRRDLTSCSATAVATANGDDEPRDG
jgi:hypothetical protein